MAEKGKALIPAATITKIDAYWRAGLRKEKVDEAEELRGMFGTVARARFREGLTTEEQFTEELRLLSYPEGDIPKYLAAGRLEYSLDLFRDLLAAWRDAVRKGNIGIDRYGELLSGVGLVPERVAGYMLREVARVRPTEVPTAIGPPGEIYLTDQGRVIVDSLRRKRQKELSTRDEEIAGLLELGMPVGYATAIADNDDIRLAEKEVIEPEKIIPAYETDDGKVKVDTIRRERRKLIIGRDLEVKRLIALEMPVWFAEAIADNDDVRLQEEELIEVAPPKAYYETDAGRIHVDTIRRRRRKLLITRDQEIRALLETGMPIEQAHAIADNDDARIAEKGGAEE